MMAFQAGSLNTGGFLACHRFVTHTTGFATLFGTEIAEGHLASSLGIVSVPLFFLLGNMISAYMIDRRITLQLRPLYKYVFGLMFFLILSLCVLSGLGFFGPFGSEASLTQDYTLLSLLCLTSGIQNATVTSASGAVVRTTHLTGLTTDLGIGIVRILTRTYKLKKQDEIRSNWMRIGIISSFILGSWLSAVIFLRAQYWGFLIPLFVCIILVWISFQADKSSTDSFAGLKKVL